MKCKNCGMTLRENAKFCDVCGERIDAELTMRADEPDRRYDHRDAYESESAPRRYDDRRESPRRRYDEEYHRSDVPRRRYAEEDQREAPRRRNDEDNYRDAPRRSYDDDYHRDDVPRRRYAEEDQREAPRRRYDDEDDYRSESPRLSRRQERELQRQKKKKKAIVISIIALLLVIAIISGIIVVVSMTSVSAAELQDAKDKYVPPAQAITIDTSLDDPSNDDIRFTYDDRARILSCTYKANGKPYDQRYTYFDKERRVNIETRYRNRPIFTKDIDYGRIKNPNQFEIVDDYYLRLDPPSLTDTPTTASSSAAPAAEETDAPAATEVPTESPTEAEMRDEDVSEYSQLEAFFQPITWWGPDEYDSRNVLGNKRNMLMCVANYYSCVDPSIYPGTGLKTYTEEEAKQIWPWDTKKLALAAFDKAEADWICKYIFNISDSEIETLYNEEYEQEYMYTDGSYYYTLWGGKGNVTSAKLKSVKTDGRFYYVVYDVYAGGALQNTGGYAVMELKTIDGAEYWSMYYNTATVPDEITPFDPEG